MLLKASGFSDVLSVNVKKYKKYYTYVEDAGQMQIWSAFDLSPILYFHLFYRSSVISLRFCGVLEQVLLYR